MTNLDKNTEAQPPVKPKHAVVPLSDVKSKRLVRELVRRRKLSPDEGRAIRDGMDLCDFYGAQDDEADTISDFDSGALEEARSRMARGELAEAVVWIGRIFPELADFPRLMARAGFGEG